MVCCLHQQHVSISCHTPPSPCWISLRSLISVCFLLTQNFYKLFPLPAELVSNFQVFSNISSEKTFLTPRGMHIPSYVIPEHFSAETCKRTWTILVLSSAIFSASWTLCFVKSHKPPFPFVLRGRCYFFNSFLILNSLS